MEHSFITLFKGPSKQPTAARPGKSKRGRSYEIPAIFAPIYLPLLIIAAVLSIPWTYVQRLKQRHRERKFAEQMRKDGRIMAWDEFESALKERRGTTISEVLGIKGPFRIWWTPEDVRAISPSLCPNEGQVWTELQSAEFRPFFDWCYAQFTNPNSGRARLVQIPETRLVPEGTRREIRAKLAGAIPTCSFRARRERRR